MTDIYSPSPPSLKPPKEVSVKKQQPSSSQQREQAMHQRLLLFKPCAEGHHCNCLVWPVHEICFHVRFFRLESVLIWEIVVQNSEYLLHVSEAAGKLLVLKLATLIVAVSDSLQKNVSIEGFYLCRKPRSQFGRSGDSEVNREAEKV